MTLAMCPAPQVMKCGQVADGLPLSLCPSVILCDQIIVTWHSRGWLAVYKASHLRFTTGLQRTGPGILHPWGLKHRGRGCLPDAPQGAGGRAGTQTRSQEQGARCCAVPGTGSHPGPVATLFEPSGSLGQRCRPLTAGPHRGTRKPCADGRFHSLRGTFKHTGPLITKRSPQRAGGFLAGSLQFCEEESTWLGSVMSGATGTLPLPKAGEHAG